VLALGTNYAHTTLHVFTVFLPQSRILGATRALILSCCSVMLIAGTLGELRTVQAVSHCAHATAQVLNARHVSLLNHLGSTIVDS